MIFKLVVYFVLTNNAKTISARSVVKFVEQEGFKVSVNTVLNYINYLKEAGIIDIKPLYSLKKKRELIYYFKVYNVDVSLATLNVKDKRKILERKLETIVYNELFYRDYQVTVLENKGDLIDFLITKNDKEYYVQVAYSITDSEAYEREFSALNGIDTRSQRIIITNDEGDFSTSSIRHISLKRFLEMEDF